MFWEDFWVLTSYSELARADELDQATIAQLQNYLIGRYFSKIKSAKQ